MDSALAVWKDWIDILQKIVTIFALVVGGIWAWYKFQEFREQKSWIQLDVKGKIFKLNTPKNAELLTWDQCGVCHKLPEQTCTHVVEVELVFSNKGKTRIRLYNIQLWLSTMRDRGEIKLDQHDGHLSLKRIVTTNNIVPPMKVEGKLLEDTAFYYIEPRVKQTIRYLTLISKPLELLQINAKFSLAQKRIFPRRERLPGETYPHTASITYQLNEEGLVIQ